MKDERGELISMTEALKSLGCTRSAATRVLRRRLDTTTNLSLGGRLEGRLVTPRCWLVYRHSVEQAARDGSWRWGLPAGSQKPGGNKRQIAKKRRS